MDQIHTIKGKNEDINAVASQGGSGITIAPLFCIEQPEQHI